MRNRPALVTFAVLLAVSLLSGQQRSTLLEHVPASAASLVNPYEGSSEAVQAGAKLYRRHCAACHGKEREGRGRAPTLRAEVVSRASPGALFWVLKNGSLAQGMPSWSKLPDQQRWQIVTYLTRRRRSSKSTSRGNTATHQSAMQVRPPLDNLQEGLYPSCRPSRRLYAATN